MTSDPIADQPPLVFTASAASKVAALIAEEANPGLMLRVYIQGSRAAAVRAFNAASHSKRSARKMIPPWSPMA